MHNIKRIILWSLITPLWLIQPACTKSHERIVFFGDSITARGIQKNGYITIIKQILDKTSPGHTIELIGAGIPANRVTHLQKRLKKDVLAKKPSLVLIYIGINDVWHWEHNQGTPKTLYRKKLGSIIKQIKKRGAGVILCTPTVIGEKYDGTNKFDAMLEEYAEISRDIAKDTDSPLIDLRKEFITYLEKNNSANEEMGILTTDGVHLNDTGNRLLAELIVNSSYFPEK